MNMARRCSECGHRIEYHLFTINDNVVVNSNGTREILKRCGYSEIYENEKYYCICTAHSKGIDTDMII